ncbi:MAG TPA: DUF3108 domain-containing protein [bacterium]|nr:DUF3108 domain-containing protein [bacterium]
MVVLCHQLLILLLLNATEWKAEKTASTVADRKNLSIDGYSEILNYKMEYLNLHVANLNFSQKMDTAAGKNYLNVTAKSTPGTQLLFSVDNYYQLEIDRESFLPLRIEKRVCQKNVLYNLILKFDHQNHRIAKDDSIEWAIQEPCFDYFSMLYFLRAKSLDQTDTVKLFIDSEFLIYKVNARFSKNQQTMTVPAGRFKVIPVRVTFEKTNNEQRPWKTDLLTNRLAQSGSTLIIWLTADELRIPVRLEYERSMLKTQLVLKSFFLQE